MKVKELRAIIEEIEGIYADAGATRPAADLADLLTLFDGCDDQDVDDFLEEVRKLYVTPTRKKKTNRPARILNERLIKRYVDALEDAGTDRAKFDPVFEELSADKVIHKDEMNAIQHRYIKGRKVWATRKAALEAIHNSFLESRYREKALEEVRKSTPW